MAYLEPTLAHDRAEETLEGDVAMIRCTAILLLLMSLTLITACRATIPPDEVTTRMNAKDEAALDDASARQDAGATDAAPRPRRRRP